MTFTLHRSDSSFRFHVTLDGEKRIVNVASKEALPSLLLNEFKLEVGSRITIQYWDTDFEDWVDVTRLDELPDKCKLNVIVKSSKCVLIFMLQ